MIFVGPTVCYCALTAITGLKFYTEKLSSLYENRDRLRCVAFPGVTTPTCNYVAPIKLGIFWLRFMNF